MKTTTQSGLTTEYMDTHKLLLDVEKELCEAVCVTPVMAAPHIPEGAEPAIRRLHAELLAYGEVEVEVEERGEVELHRGNTEFDYEAEVVKVDTRSEVVRVPMDRICYGERHYDV